MRHTLVIALFSSFLSLSSFADESLFSVTPEQMVFSSKLSDKNRKIFSHQFSVTERQKALDLWQRLQQEEEHCQADDVICSIVNPGCNDDDVCLDN